MGVSIYLLHDGFFSFAVVRQQLVFDFFLMGKDNQSNQKHHDKAKYNADTSADGGRYRGFIVSRFIREEHGHTICEAARNDKTTFWTDEQAGCKAIYNPYNTCYNDIAAQVDNDCP